ncbi:putative cytochrome P450 [Teratosphaeria nubilosa]|uniref:Putative cytochrome P450 n=1 Tax=Teratosphaeria nubilosa TaxID=161662 RepID=A0A6G1KT93_9PEZI|nr:putative cytochrome P450 [Teratosphaeria nubilosa]
MVSLIEDWRILASTLPLIIIIWSVSRITYNIWFHPLADFPGPLLARATLLWRIKHSLTGRFHRSIQSQHKKHPGSVVRVSPNELSFASVDSWKAIYGNPVSGRQQCVKSEFYDVFAAGYNSKCIGSERDPRRHAKMKKHLTAAFSTKALTEQEETIQKCVNGMIAKLRALGQQEDGLNMVHWYEMIAFDILGEMAFGQTFHCIENEAPHFWFEMLTKYLFFVTLIDNCRRYPLIMIFSKMLAPFTARIQEKNMFYTRQLVQRRLQSSSGRRDFLTHLVDKVKSGEVEQEELNAHAATLVVAGGETVSSFLAATTFYLCKNTQVLAKLRREIRSRFVSQEEIVATSALQLPYLQAVIQEGLRIFPPGSQGFPRICPGMQIDRRWVPAGTEVYTSAWTITHDEQYFPDPDDFIPERWTDQGRSDVREASQPFSLGPRMCIGRNFALVEASLILCKIIWEFDLELVGPHQEWERRCHMHVNWWKPAMHVRFLKRGMS